MASTMNIDAPGAYPVTPLNEEPAQQPQQTNRNRLHKSPRGLNDNTERNAQQDTHPSGHSFAGSGIYVDEASLTPSADPIQSSHRNPFQQTQFNKETPRRLANDARSADHRLGGSSMHPDDSSSSRENSTGKPGIMTGAYSRVGARDDGVVPDDNYTYNNTSTPPQLFGHKSQQPDNTQPINKATNAFTPVNSPAVSTPLGPSDDTTANDPVGHSVKAQSGLREDLNAQHNSPYWGDIPFGTGVYNGVTGHGSKEPITHQRSLHDQYGTTANTGVYNGITGHGSKESTNSPAFQQYDRDAVTEDSHRQRAFPLTNTAHTTATSRPNDVDEHRRDYRSEATLDNDLPNSRDAMSAFRLDDANRHGGDSRSKGFLVGAGAATAAGGYAAHKHSQTGNKEEARERFAGEKPDELRHSNTAAHPLQSNHYKDAKAANTNTNSSGERNLTHRQFAAAPVGNKHVAEGQTTSEEYSPRTTTATRNRETNDASNPGYYGAAGAAAAGVGAFGMHEHAGRGDTKNYHSSTSGVEPEPERSHARQAGTGEREKPQYKTLGDGTPSGVASGTHQQQEAQRSSSDSSNGGQYNVPSSGTPSGINLEHVQAEKQRHETDPSALLGSL